jgi:hypothetical protein
MATNMSKAVWEALKEKIYIQYEQHVKREC